MGHAGGSRRDAGAWANAARGGHLPPPPDFPSPCNTPAMSGPDQQTGFSILIAARAERLLRERDAAPAKRRFARVRRVREGTINT